MADASHRVYEDHGAAIVRPLVGLVPDQAGAHHSHSYSAHFDHGVREHYSVL
jgi:hypothetical protein